MATSQEDNLDKKAAEFLKHFIDGGTFSDLSGLTDEQMEALYSYAYQNYGLNNFEVAKNVFNMLCLLDHTQERFYMGLGASLQGLKDYDEAIEAYSMAALYSALGDPKPIFFSAMCFLKKGDKESAKVALESTSIMGRADHPEDKTVLEQAKALLESLKSE